MRSQTVKDKTMSVTTVNSNDSASSRFKQIFNVMTAEVTDSYIKNSAQTVAVVFDGYHEEEHWDSDEITETPTKMKISEGNVHLHSSGVKSMISEDYLRRAEEFFDVDLEENLDHISVNPEYNYIVKIEPEGAEAMLLVAPVVY